MTWLLKFMLFVCHEKMLHNLDLINSVSSFDDAEWWIQFLLLLWRHSHRQQIGKRLWPIGTFEQCTTTKWESTLALVTAADFFFFFELWTCSPRQGTLTFSVIKKRFCRFWHRGKKLWHSQWRSTGFVRILTLSWQDISTPTFLILSPWSGFPFRKSVVGKSSRPKFATKCQTSQNMKFTSWRQTHYKSVHIPEGKRESRSFYLESQIP